MAVKYDGMIGARNATVLIGFSLSFSWIVPLRSLRPLPRGTSFRGSAGPDPRPLPNNLIATGDLAAQRLGRLIWDPDFRQEAARVDCASTPASIVSVLIFACAMTRTCFGLAITTFFTCGLMTAATAAALPVASTTTTSSSESCSAKAVNSSRRISTRPSRLSLPSSHATASAKARWISSPMMRMPAPSILLGSFKTGAGGQHDTY